MYQYIDDILVGGPDATMMGKTQTHIENLRLQISAEKVQLPVLIGKDSGYLVEGKRSTYSSQTLTTLEQVRIPENKTELQHALSLLTFWRQHITGFSIIACPLYDLTHKRTIWDQTPIHEEVLKLLNFEAGYIRP